MEERQRTEIVVQDSANQLPRLFNLSSYKLISFPLAIASSIISYQVALKTLPDNLPIPVAYITISILLALIAIEGLLTAFSARMAKIPNRTWDKAFFSAVGINFINSLFSVASLPFVESNKIVAVAMSFIAGIGAWFFLKRVYGITHRQVMNMLAWSAVFIGIIALVAVIIAGYFLYIKFKEWGI